MGTVLFIAFIKVCFILLFSILMFIMLASSLDILTNESMRLCNLLIDISFVFKNSILSSSSSSSSINNVLYNFNDASGVFN